MRVVDTDAPSHIHRNTVAVLSLAEEEKKRKYNSAAETRRASFTPFIVPTDGMLGREANFLLKEITRDSIEELTKVFIASEQENRFNPGWIHMHPLHKEFQLGENSESTR